MTRWTKHLKIVIWLTLWSYQYPGFCFGVDLFRLLILTLYKVYLVCIFEEHNVLCSCYKLLLKHAKNIQMLLPYADSAVLGLLTSTWSDNSWRRCMKIRVSIFPHTNPTTHLMKVNPEQIRVTFIYFLLEFPLCQERHLAFFRWQCTSHVISHHSLFL